MQKKGAKVMVRVPQLSVSEALKLPAGRAAAHCLTVGQQWLLVPDCTLCLVKEVT